MRFKIRVGRFVAVCAGLGFAAAVFAQQPAREQGPPAANGSPQKPRLADYILGPDDEIVIMSVDAEEISGKPIRVSTSGDINLPLVGRIHVAGMTVQQVESEVNERLKLYIKRPEVAVSVTQLRSQPVSVFGAVRSPGIIQLEGRKTLIEVLSLAGGMATDASSKITIQRLAEWGPIPLSTSVTMDAAAPYRIAEVNIGSIIDATHPEQNIQILPFDVITVKKAQVVYVMGDVRKPGGFTLNDQDEISVLQLLARAEGLGPTAASKDAKIIRTPPGLSRVELDINLKDLLAGKIKDIMMQPEDILFVPDSYARGAFRRTLDTVIQMTTGMIIYR